MFNPRKTKMSKWHLAVRCSGFLQSCCRCAVAGQPEELQEVTVRLLHCLVLCTNDYILREYSLCSYSLFLFHQIETQETWRDGEKKKQELGSRSDFCILYYLYNLIIINIGGACSVWEQSSYLCLICSFMCLFLRSHDVGSKWGEISVAKKLHYSSRKVGMILELVHQ